MNRLNVIAVVLLLVFGLVAFGFLLSFFYSDLDFYFNAKREVVVVERVDIQAEYVSDPIHASQSVALTSELTLSTPKGPRIVWESVSGSRDFAQQRAQELRALQGRSVSLFLKDDHPNSFAISMAFPWVRVLSLLTPLLLLILPSALALRHHFASRRKNP